MDFKSGEQAGEILRGLDSMSFQVASFYDLFVAAQFRRGIG